jgi:uncharacterized membrane protein YesL
MSTRSNWRVVPGSATLCWVFLLAGGILLANSIWRMATDGVAVLSVVASVMAALLMIVAVVGLVSPEKRGRW